MTPQNDWLDFNTAGPQRETDLIPDNTVAVLSINLRPAPDGGWLRRSKAGDSRALDIEFTVVDGPHAKRKFWGLYTVESSSDSEGHAKAIEISRNLIRGILESARGILPDDESAAAREGRRPNDISELDGLRFVGKIGIEAGTINQQTGEKYKDKNRLLMAVTPDKKAWTKPEQVERAARQMAMTLDQGQRTNVAGIASQQPTPQRPSWAR